MKQRTRGIYIIISSVMAFAFNLSFTAAAVYRIQIAQLAPYQLILVGTALEIGVLVFETPTGVLADLKSRKLSVLIGLAVIGIGFAIEASFTAFVMIAFAQIVWGMGYTFISGALHAWVSDELMNQGIEELLLSGAQYGRFFSILGIGVAMGLGAISIRLAMYTAAGVMILSSVVLSGIMPENHFSPTVQKGKVWSQYWNQMTSGIQHIRKHRILSVLLIVFLLYGLYSEGIDRLYELYILEHLNLDNLLNIPAVWVIGGLNAIISIAGILMLGLVKKHLSAGIKTVILVIQLTMMMVVGILLFAYSPSVFFAMAGFLVFRMTREGTYPLLEAIQLRNTPSEIKATVLSTFSQTDAIGQLVSGPLMVAVAAMFGIQPTFAFSAVLLAAVIVMLMSLIRRMQVQKEEY